MTSRTTWISRGRRTTANTIWGQARAFLFGESPGVEDIGWPISVNRLHGAGYDFALRAKLDSWRHRLVQRPGWGG